MIAPPRVLVLLPLALASLARAQQPTVGGASVEMVSVDVSVIREGRAVPGLKAEQFEVRDEGVRRAVELVASGETPLHVLLVLDASESVGGDRVKRLVGAALSIFPDLRPTDRTGLVTFSEEVRLLADVSGSPLAVRGLLGRVQTGGGTSLRDAVWSALKRSEAVRGRTLMLLFTDGTDTSSWLTEDAVLAMARQSDCVVHVIHTGRERAASEPASDPFLSRLAGITGGRLWESGEAQDLELAVRRALAEMRSRYVLRFERPPDSRPGWHRLEVKLRGAKADVLARRGYFVAAAPPR
jgi:VWFA-related protein